MRYGPTGTEFEVVLHEVVNHTHIRVRTVPGVGSLLLFSVRVAGQSSTLPPAPASCAMDAITGLVPCVSYAPPVILALSPSSGPTLSSSPITATITGTNFGLLDRAVDVAIIFGNEADGTQRTLVPLSWTPRWQDGVSPAVHTLRFTVPEGLGASRAVAVELRHGGTGAVLRSDPVLFEYTPPTVLFVELRPLDEASASTLGFVPAAHNNMLVTIHGNNFGPPAHVRGTLCAPATRFVAMIPPPDPHPAECVCAHTKLPSAHFCVHSCYSVDAPRAARLAVLVAWACCL